jgi:hypothetical protein
MKKPTVPRITEKHLQELVRKAAILTGWRLYHTFNSMHSVKGFPDCCLVKGNKLWFVELKNETGKVTPEQQDWLEALARVPGVEVQLLRPSGFDKFYEELKK